MNNAQIYDKIDEWHDGAGLNMELHEYLGWTEDEYWDWVRTSELPKRDQKQNPVNRRDNEQYQ